MAHWEREKRNGCSLTSAKKSCVLVKHSGFYSINTRELKVIHGLNWYGPKSKKQFWKDQFNSGRVDVREKGCQRKSYFTHVSGIVRHWELRFLSFLWLVLIKRKLNLSWDALDDWRLCAEISTVRVNFTKKACCFSHWMFSSEVFLWWTIK